MPAVAQNFTIPQGSTSQINFVVDPPVGETLLGTQIYWSVFPLLLDLPQLPAVIRKSLDNGLQVNDPIAQTFYVNLIQADTEDLPPGNYYHEVVVTDPTGALTVTTEGVMTLTQRATIDFTVPVPVNLGLGTGIFAEVDAFLPASVTGG